ncbi:MAG TPA: carboxypeptidase-like regulatory domain-containing protein [Gemmatimonadaceae bacterium]|nr:carboxypeptidase-like regulatory domain-containing protein [Gemmatimonadaceae bacterium]
MLDATGKSVVREQVREEHRVSDRPFVSLPADTLLSRGFVQSDSTGTVYNAPDADVLLAERFADTHCLRLATASSSDSTRIGLQFAPVRSRERVSDITGILWLDRATARLESLEYGYTNLPRSLEDARPSGRVSFLQLATGGWVVGGWEIRMPHVQLRDQSTFQGSGLSNMQGGRVERRRIAEVTGIQVEGGDILEVSQEGVSVWAQRSASVILHFRDAVTREPVRQVRGTVAGTKVSFVSDSGGGATLPAMPSGEYTLNLHTPFQDSLQLEPFRARLIVGGDSSSSVELTLPARNTVLRGACGVDLDERKEAVIIGTVVDSSGTAWSGALVLALWQAPPRVTGSDISVRTEQRTTQADANGFFRVCGVPQGRSAQLFVGQQTRSARSHTVSVPIGRTVVEVQLRPTR